MHINSIFYTIQGEGRYIGRPSIFIRLMGCNLECLWCDTKYTWLFSKNQLIKLQSIGEIWENEPYDREAEGQHLSVDQVINKIEKYNCKNLVITGGEPLLQREELNQLIVKLNGYTVEVETNGTLEPLDVKVSYNVSPKLKNSHNTRETIIYQALAKFLEKKAIFKFVISDEKDLLEIEEIVKEVKIPNDRIYLMPKANTSDELREKVGKVIQLCKDSGYNYSHRLHVEVWNDRRDV